MTLSRIQKVLIEEGSENHPLARKVQQMFPSLPLKTCLEDREIPGHHAMRSPGKDTLYLLRHKGEFLKPCPGTREYICCGYQILNIGTNCPLDCSYCILQSYFNQPYLRIYLNLTEILDKLFKRIDEDQDAMFRIGTGEFTDSLALDRITGWSSLLIEGFSKRKNAILEFKTKTGEIQGLLRTSGRDRIIVSWSLNSPLMGAREEKGALSVEGRLKAARQCQKEGFALGFHFDPLVPHQNWKEEYRKTIDLMDRYLEPKGIAWISLGSFRFMPSLKDIIRQRHPQSQVLNGEFVPGLDGKMRYFKPIRIELYDFMKRGIERWHADAGLYLCMESDEVWRRSMGWSPVSSEGLCRYLDERVRHIFG